MQVPNDLPLLLPAFNRTLAQWPKPPPLLLRCCCNCCCWEVAEPPRDTLPEADVNDAPRDIPAAADAEAPPPLALAAGPTAPASASVMMACR